MSSINGDWFHSRSSSNWDELITVRTLVIESQKAEFAGFGWSGGRQDNPQMYRFAGVANIEPSAMQTKIRAWIRYGFIKDTHTCPLIWTRMGSLWNDLYTIGNLDAAKKIYELVLATSLALFAFNNSREQFTRNPTRGQMPLKFLLGILDARNSISIREFNALVDGNTKRVGKNASYWERDLINSGLFKEEPGRLVYTEKYRTLVQQIKEFNPNPILNETDWQEILDNPLISISPFRISLQQIFEELSGDDFGNGEMINDIITEPLIDVVAEQEEQNIPEADVLSTNTRFSQSMRRVRNATWSIRIKKRYSYLCVVPNCDVKGQLFVGAAHIKPDRVPEEGIPHRTHILNGLCLCSNCHIAFDNGFFSLTDDYKILISNKFDTIPDQSLKTIILSSADQKIKNRSDNRFPLVDFIQYHRNIHSFQQ